MVLIRLALASAHKKSGKKNFFSVFSQLLALLLIFRHFGCNETHLFYKKRRNRFFATERCMMFICDPIER